MESKMSTVTYTIDSETGALIKVNNKVFVSQDPNYYDTYIATSSPNKWVTVSLDLSNTINEQTSNLATAPQDNGTLSLNNQNNAFFGSLKDNSPSTTVSGNNTKLIDGSGGKDIIQGKGDAQLLMGGLGDDTITAGNGGGNRIYGGTGNDVLRAGNGNSSTQAGDRLYGGSGNDQLYGGEHSSGLAFDKLFAGNGNDTVYATNGSYAEGGKGSDVLIISLTSAQAADAQVRTALTAYKNFLQTHNDVNVDSDPNNLANISIYSASNPNGKVFDFSQYGGSSPSANYLNSMNIKALDFEALKIYVNGTLDAPIARPDAFSATEGQAALVTGSVATNDSTAIAGTSLSYSLNAPVPGLSLNANGSYSFNAKDPAYQYLSPGQVLNLVANYTATDQLGAFATSSLTITITGISNNHPATITGTGTGTVTEDGTLTAGNTLTVSDPNPGESKFQTPSSLAGTYGSFSFNSNSGVWSYTLNNNASNVQALSAGSVVHDTLLVKSLDGTASKIIDVTIKGSNDAAIISGNTTGVVVEAGGFNNNIPGTPTVSGQLTATDVDSASTFIAVGACTPSASNYGTYEINTNGLWVYTLDNTNAAVQALNVGQTLTDSFVVRTADGTSQTITITINGSNDAAKISGTIASSVVEAGGISNGTPGTPTVTGTLTDTDVDNTPNTFIAVPAGTASANNYGTYQMTSNGVWTYALNNNNAAVQALNVGQTLTDTFTISTIDGTTKTITITINGANDAAVISGTSAGSVLEAGGVANGTAGTPTASGTLTLTDVDNTVGSNPFIAVSAGTASANNYGTYQMNSNGTWTYTLNNNNAAVQALNIGQSLIDSFLVKALDGTSKTIVITINGSNDAAVISGTVSGSVTEAGGVANATPGTSTATGTLTDTDVDNAANSFTAVPAGAASTNGYGTYQMSSSGTWTYTLNNNNAAVQALNVGATLTDSFTVNTIDGTPKTITITINGANDAAVITGTSTGSVVEAGGVSNGTPGTPSVTGQLISTDVDNPNTFSTALASSPAYGSASINSAGQWTYNLNNTNATVQALNVGQTLTDSFTVKSIDGTTKVVTITINGTNDAAVISGTISSSVTEAGGVANGTIGIPTTSGQLTDTDVDNPVNTFSTTLVSNPSYGSATITSAGLWTYTLNNSNAAVEALNVNQTLTDTFIVQSIDNTPKTITITIRGTNDAAVITGVASGSVVEAGGVANGTPGTPTASGMLISSDVDNPSTFTAVAAGAATVNHYGTYEMNANGTWTYTLNNNLAAVQALNVGQTLSDSFIVKSIDGTSQTVNITINGTNDAAVISGTSVGSVVEAGGVANGTPGTPTATGLLTDTDVDNTPNTFSTVLVANPLHGTASMSVNGQWSYNLNNADAAVNALNTTQTLIDTFTVQTIDGTQKTITITITGANDAPVAGADTNSGNQGTTITGTVAVNDFDVDNGAVLTYTLNSPVPGLVFNADGTYSLNTNDPYYFTGSNQNVVANYTVTDEHGASATSTLTITVIGVNHPPVAMPDTASVAEDSTIIGSVATNDSDPDANSTLTFSLDAAVTGLTFSNNGSYTFDASNAAYQHLAQGATQTVVANYTVTDEHGASAHSTLTITITGTNDTPVISGIATAPMQEDISPFVVSRQLTAFDVDDGATQTWSIAGSATGTYGSITVDQTGLWTYTLNNSSAAVQSLAQGEHFDDVFTVRVMDEHGAFSDQTVTITVTGTNDAPIISGVTSGVVQEDGLIFASGQLVGADVDHGAIPFWSVVGSSTGTYGSITVDNTGLWKYTLDNASPAVQALAQGEHHDEVFTIKLMDEFGAFSNQTVTITVTGTNDAPVISGIDAGTVQEDVAPQFASGQLNASDIDHGATQAWSVQGSNNGVYGSISVNNTGLWTYTLNNASPVVQALAEGEQHTETFTIRVMDEHGAFDDHIVNILVKGTNDAPTAVADTNSGLEDSTITGSVALNDTDVDNGASLSFALNAPVAGLILNTDGSYTFDAGNAAYQHLAEGATQAVVANYTVTDEHGASSTSTLTITLTGTNDAPIAVADTNSGFEDNTITGSVAPNDSDIDDGASLSFALNAPVAGLILNTDGSYTFDAGNATYQHLAEGATQAVVANYTVTDEHGASSTSTLTITLTGTNDAPIISGVDTANVQEDIAPLFASGQLTASDVDDGATQAWSVQGSNNGVYGSISVDNTGLWTYTLNNASPVVQALAEGEQHSETFTIRVMDEHGAFDDHIVSILVKGTNDAPTAVADTNSGLEDSTITGSVALNDTDVDNGASLSFALNAPVAGLILNTDGSYTFDASNAAYQYLAQGAVQNVVANYTVTDEHGASSTSILTITLTGTNDAPIAVADTNSGFEDSMITGSVAFNDSDVDDGTILSFALNSPVAGLILNTDGSYTFDAGNAAYQHLAEGATQAVVANYIVTDEHGASSTSTLTITLTGTNNAPLISGIDAGNVQEDIAPHFASGQLTAFDVDDGATQAWSVEGSNNGIYGSISVDNTGLWTYTLNNASPIVQALAEGEQHTETFTIRVMDEHGAFDDHIVNILVKGKNDAPIALADINSGFEDSTITGSVALNDTDVDNGASLSFALNAPVAGLILNTDGSYTFDAGNTAYQHLAEGAVQNVVANYTVTDEHGASSTSTLTITLTGTNDAPVAVADTNSGLEDSTITGSVALNDSDVDDGTSLSFILNAPVAGLTLNLDGSYSFDAGNVAYQHLAQGAIQNVVAHYTVTDEHGASATSTLTITLTGTNDAPIAVADTNSGLEDSIITGSVASNDSDLDDGASLSFSLNAPVAGLTFNSDGSYVFDAGDAAYQHLAQGEVQDIIAHYTVTDEFGASSTNTLTITLTGVNDPADLSTDIVSLTEGNTAADISTSGTLTISDVDSPATFVAQSGTAGNYGTFSIDASGAWTYTANGPHDEFQDGVDYQELFNVFSADGTQTAVIIHIEGTNDAAILSSDTRNLAEGNAASDISTSGTLTIHDVDSPETFVAQTNAAGLYGTFNIDANGVWSYVASSPHDEFKDGVLYQDSFDVVSADGTHTTVNINITGTNDAAILSSATVDLNEGDTAADISTSGMLTISDVDSPETFVAQTNVSGAYGKFSIDADGNWSYTADNAHNEFIAGNVYQEIFSVSSADGTLTSVTINITGTNDAAVLSSDTRNLTEGNAAADISTSGTLTISDPDSPQTFVAQSGIVGAFGTFAIDNQGAWTYTASSAHDEFKEGQNYQDVFDVQSADGTHTSVTINIAGTNDAPVAMADTASADEDTVITGFVSTNDSDIDQDAVLQYALNNGPIAGLTFNANGSYDFDAGNAAYQHLGIGDQQVIIANYTVTDEHGASATSTLTITINGTNDAPVAVADTNNGNLGDIISGSVAANDSDIDDGAVLTFSLDNPVAGLTFNPNGTYSFNSGDPAYAAGGDQTILAYYTVTDEHGASANSTLTISIHDTQGLLAVADTDAATEDTAISGSVAANDLRVDSDAIFSLDNGPIAGLVFNPDGTYTFDAGDASYQHLAEGQHQNVVVHYTVTNDNNATSSSTLTITLIGTNDAPIAVADTGSVDEDNAINGNLAQNVSDVDDNTVLTFTLDNGPIAGLTFNPDGTYRLYAGDPAYQHLGAGDNQVIQLQYTVTDEHNASSSSTLDITITGTNDAPEAISAIASVDQGNTIAGFVAGTDVDDNAILSYALNTSPIAGLSFNSDGSYTFDANDPAYQHLAAGQAQTIVIPYTVSDEHNATSSSTLSITVNGINDAPVVSSVLNLSLTEGGSSTTLNLLDNASDPDDGETASLSISDIQYYVDGVLTASPAGVSLNDNQLNIDPNDPAFSSLASGQSSIIEVQYNVLDAQGAMVAQTATITINGIDNTNNTAPHAVADSNSGIEGTSDLPSMAITGNVLANDSDAESAHSALTVSTAGTFIGQYGTLNLNTDGSYTYTINDNNSAVDALNIGGSLVETFAYTMSDNDPNNPLTASSTLSITINGADDAPVISGVSSGSATENFVLAARGQLTASDVDNTGPQTWSIVGSDTGAYGHIFVDNTGYWTYILNNGALDLAENEQYTEHFIIRVADEDGAIKDQPVSITVTGTNGTPIVSGPLSGSVQEDTAPSTISGQLTATDIDHGATQTWSIYDSSHNQLVSNLNGTYGALTLSNNGLWTYNLDNNSTAVQALAAGEQQNETFFIRVVDNKGAINQQNLVITVTGTYDAPIAVADTASSSQDEVKMIDVLANDIHVDHGSSLTLIDVSAPGNKGSATIVNNQLQFNPGTDFDHLVQGETETITLNYTMQDGVGTQSSSAVTLTITGTNDPAQIIGNSTGAVTEDGTLSANGALSISDVDTGENQFVLGSSLNAQYGSFSFDTLTGAWTYQLNNGANNVQALGAGQVVHDTLQVSSMDGTDSHVINITITGTNDPAIITGDVSGSVDELGYRDINSPPYSNSVHGTLIYNDVDDPSSSFNFFPGTNVSANGYGIYNIDPTGNWYYTLNNSNPAVNALALGETLSDSFNVRTVDGTMQTITITINGANDAPVAVADTASSGQDEVKLIDVLANDTDVDHNHVFSLVSVSAPPLNKGSAAIVNNQLQFNPGTDFDHLAQGDTETITLNYTMQDEYGIQSSSTVNLTITGTNDAPIAMLDTDSSSQDELKMIDVLANDTDVDDGAVLTLINVSAPANKGSASIVNNQLQFNPGNDFRYLAQGEQETVVLNYTMQDEQGAQSSSTVNLTVFGTNDTPTVSAPLSSTATAGTSAYNNDLLAGALDPDQGETDTLSVSNISYTVNGGASSSNAPAGISLNGHTLTVNPSDPAFTSLSVNQSTVIVLSYDVVDVHGALVSQTETITIHGANPVNQPATISGNTTGSVVEAGGLNNVIANTPIATGTLLASDPDNPPNTFTASSGLGINHYGNYQINTSGNWTYTLDNTNAAVEALNIGQTLTDTFTVESIDGTPQSIIITINGANDAAVLSAASVNLTESNLATDISTSGTLTISDVDSAASFQAQTGTGTGGYGIFSIDASGHWTYTANSAHNEFVAGITYDDVFMVQSADGTSTSIAIHILGTNDAPIISSGAGAALGSVKEDTTFVASGQLSASDVDNNATQAWSVVGANQSAYGSISVNNSGLWTYTLNNNATVVQHLGAGQSYNDIFTIRVTDDQGATADQVVTITVYGTNDPALIGGPISGTVTEAGVSADTPNASGTLSVSDVDTGENSFLTTLSSNPSFGTATMSTGGVWNYTLNNANATVQALNVGQTLTDTFTVNSFDNTPKVITITINGANDAAVITGTSTGSVLEAGVSVGTNATGTLSSTDIDNSNVFVAAMGTTTYGTYQIDANGIWTYTLNNNNPNIQLMNTDPQNTGLFTTSRSDSFTVFTTDGTTKIVNLTIVGANDAPSFSSAPSGAQGSVTEDTSTSFIGTLIAFDVDDYPSPQDWSIVGSSMGIYGSIFALQGTYGNTLGSDGTGRWFYNLNNNLGIVQSLAAGETRTEQFTVRVTDYHGATADQVVTITINGSNDPVALIGGNQFATVTELANTSDNTLSLGTASGNVTFTDIDSIDIHTISSTILSYSNTYILNGGIITAAQEAAFAGFLSYSTSVAAGTYVVPWMFSATDNNFDFLGANSTLTINYALSVSDPSGSIATKNISVDIVGANDAVQIIGSAGTQTFFVNERVGLSNSSLADVASGTINFADPDRYDSHLANSITSTLVGLDYQGSPTASQLSTANGTPWIGKLSFSITDTSFVNSVQQPGSLVWQFSTADNILDFISAGQTLNLNYQITFNDGGASQNIVVSIIGSNDAATIFGTTTDFVTESGGTNNGTTGTLVASGTVFDNDVDNTINTFLTTVTGGTHASSITMSAGGNWTYTLNDADPAVQALNVGQTITDTFAIQSIDGTQQNIVITIRGANDAPVANNDLNSGNEGNSITPSVPMTGNVLANDTDDGPTTLTVTSVGTFTNATNYGTLVLSANGNYTYTINDANATVNALNVGSSLTDTFNYTVSDSGSPALSGTAKIIVTINGTNDPAIIGGTATGTVLEAGGVGNGTAGTQVASGTLNDTDVDNTPNTFSTTLITPASYGVANINTGGLWTYSLNNANATVQALNVGQTLTDTFVVQSSDGTPKSIVVTIQGANDNAIISGTTTGAVTEAYSGPAPVTSGTLISNDVDNSSLFSTTLISNPNPAYGTASMSSGGTWNYTLNYANPTIQTLLVGNTLSDSFTVQSIDGTQQIINITINGSNHAASISGPNSGSMTEDNGSYVTGGTLVVSDSDAGQSTFQTPSSLTGTYGNFSFNSTSGVWGYTLTNGTNGVAGPIQSLAAGAILHDTLVVTSFDGTASKVIDITITGTNDLAIISGTSTGTVIEASGVNNATLGQPIRTGTLTDTDIDNPANTFSTTLFANPTYGTATMSTGGTWSYTLNNSNTFVQALNVGNTLLDTFIVQTVDGTQKPVVITINGANDVPFISNLSINTNVSGIAPITFTVNDFDSATLTMNSNGASGTSHFGGFPTTSFGAGTTFTLTPIVQTTAVADILNLKDGQSTAAAVITYYIGTNGADSFSAIGSGSWLLYGFDGNDTFTSSAVAPNTFVGGTGNDSYTIRNVGDVVIENVNEGNDTIRFANDYTASSFNYTIPVNIENLDFSQLSSSVNVNATGSAGNNIFISNLGVDTFSGGAGNDTYFINNVGDVVIETVTPGVDAGGVDLISSSVTYTLPVFVENLTLTGSANINGTGNALNNIITSNSGIGTLTGGGGIDTYIINNTSDIVRDNGQGLVQSYVDFSLSNTYSVTNTSGVRTLQLLGTGNISGSGDYHFGSQTIIGNVGDNTLTAGLGSVIGTTISLHTLIGGQGNDYYVINEYLSGPSASTVSTDLVIENPGEGIDTVFLMPYFVGNQNYNYVFSYTLPDNIENVTVQNPNPNNDYQFSITGTNYDNIFTSNTAINYFIGGQGNDTYIINNVNDVIQEDSFKGGIDTVITNFNYALGPNLENLTFTGSNNLTGTGTNADNILTSNTGIDTLIGLGGNDTYIISNSQTKIIDDDAGSVVQSYVNYNLTLSHATTLVLLGSSNLAGYGNVAGDTIIGNSGSNTLAGVSGITLVGGTGADTMYGGGNIAFKYNAPNESGDIIIGFTHNSDYLLFSKANFNVNANSTGTVLSPTDFTIGLQYETASTHFIYDDQSRQLYYDADANGAGSPVVIAIFPTAPTITYSDIHLF